jgi:hypothetical protein
MPPGHRPGILRGGPDRGRGGLRATDRRARGFPLCPLGVRVAAPVGVHRGFGVPRTDPTKTLDAPSRRSGLGRGRLRFVPRGDPTRCSRGGATSRSWRASSGHPNVQGGRPVPRHGQGSRRARPEMGREAGGCSRMRGLARSRERRPTQVGTGGKLSTATGGPVVGSTWIMSRREAPKTGQGSES